MRALVVVVLVLAALWSGYWFAGAGIVRSQAERAFAMAGARGVDARYDSLSVQGFPNRFDLTVTRPALADPAAGWGWEAPFLQVLALSYQPWHVIVAFPPEQIIASPHGTAVLTADRLRASLRAQPRAALPLQQVTLVGDGIGLLSDRLGPVTAERARLATRALDGAARSHEVGVEILNLAPDPALVARLGDVPAAVERLRLDADLDFAAPIDRFAARARPALTGLRLREALLVWGDVSAFAEGRLVPDAAGRAEGSLQLRLTNWRRLLPMAVTAGVLPPGAAQTAERMLGLLARQSGDAESIDLTLRFADGLVSFGAMPLGPAPMLR
jgi:hypothetical protein